MKTKLGNELNMRKKNITSRFIQNLRFLTSKN